MNEDKQKELLKALKLIKDICLEQKRTCADCPFYSNDNGCNITNDYPSRWEIQEKGEKWRAFYD